MTAIADNSPQFTVVMPCYNHRAFVGEAVESIRRQTFDQWELVVVDDGSSDGSGEIVDALAAQDPRIRVFHQANAGPSAARNRAIAEASGDWLALVDSDDVWFPDALAAFANTIRQYPEARVVHAHYHRLNSDGSISELAGYPTGHVTRTADYFARFLAPLCVHRSVFERVGNFDERLRSSEDYDFYLRASIEHPFYSAGSAAGLRRRHATNISRPSGRTRLIQAMVAERFVKSHGGHRVLAPNLVRRRLHHLYYSAGREYLRAGCFGQAANALARAATHRRTAKCLLLWSLAACVRPIGRTDGRELPAI